MTRKVNWKDKELLSVVIEKSTNYREVLTSLGLSTQGSNNITLKRWIEKHEINISHFNPYLSNMQQLKIKNTIPLMEILDGEHPQYHTHHLKRRLLKSKTLEEVCNRCGLGPIWNDERLGLQLDHINGNSTDHKLENLQLLCPNCHSQNITFAGRNK